MNEFSLAMDRTRQNWIEADLLEFTLGLFRRYHNRQEEIESALTFAAREISREEGIIAGEYLNHYELAASNTALAKRKMRDGAWHRINSRVEEAITNWPYKEEICQEELELIIVQHCHRYENKYHKRIITRALVNVAITVASDNMVEHFSSLAQEMIKYVERTLPEFLDEKLGKDRYPRKANKANDPREG